MSLAADALQPFVVAALFRLEDAPVCHLPDIITSTRRHGFYLSAARPQNAIDIDFYDALYLATAVAGDARRLATVSYLSLRTIENEIAEVQTLGWGIIKLYYAAFYAGHSILRLLGESCSYMTSAHVQQLTSLAIASGAQVTDMLETGLYHYSMNALQTGVRIMKRRSALGPHETLWRIFDDYLDTRTEQLLTGHLTPMDARRVFGKLTELRDVLKTNGLAGGNWLSVVRNSVQYRQELGVWHPCGIKRHRREAISRIAGQWKRDPMEVDLLLARPQELERFVGACAFIVALSRALLTRIAERSFGGRSFARAPLSVV